ncbi:MAG: inositol monophosphatase, partial [candidate division KSB1 bacterium]|nr:inositol monophosphatase [candidate division KSB1 bacterium]
MTFKQLAIATARQAGAILRDNLGQYGTYHAENKSPFDYVTEVDRTCEQFIINSITEHFPDHEILSEESGRNKNDNEFCWIVDPLDGTTNFIHGNPHIAVSIALQHAGKIILGVVYDPFRDEMYSAERGKGAYCNNKPIHVSHLNQINRCLIATGFPFRCK